jgi:flagellar biogenesis protein FliO
MRDIIFVAGFLLILILPVIALVWIIYRLVKGSDRGPSIKL